MATKNKVIEGTKDWRVVKGSKDPRQLRCKHCHQLAVEVPDGKGGTTTKCSGCGRTYQSVTI